MLGDLKKTNFKKPEAQYHVLIFTWSSTELITCIRQAEAGAALQFELEVPR